MVYIAIYKSYIHNIHCCMPCSMILVLGTTLESEQPHLLLAVLAVIAIITEYHLDVAQRDLIANHNKTSVE